ncbi:MAG: tRNA (adenosine(37)-N6)-dimethylallyltransferase MiaA [Cellulosilyticum sp.]|nr:tRNA (adenosine(37)-N6)-dimethylallyltransferase MiaA [Cellulosilyticum sp.]
MKKPLILIAGPTASGKTKTSVLLAKAIGGEIISADSMQIYKGMDIGTAKVKPEEMEDVPHYMIDEWPADFPCSVATFKERVNTYLDAIYAKGKIPILVGGTGFYINAILYDTQFEETEADTTYRTALEQIAKEEGPLALHEKLRAVDPKSAESIHHNNVKRVIRALEYYKDTGMPISEHNAREKEKRSENESPYDYTFFALSMDRGMLYERINLRIDQMIEEGLVEEVKYFFDLGLSEDLPSMKAIGYKEFFPYFKGQQSLESCVEKLKQNTRNYAKRQLTWFRHQAQPIFIDVEQLGFDAPTIVEEMIKNLPK